MKQNLLQILTVAGIAATYAGASIAVYLYYREKWRKGHARRRFMRRLALFSNPGLLVAFAALALNKGQADLPDPLFVMGFLLMVYCLGYVILFEPISQVPEALARRMYKEDPGYCGRCEYDLAGNTTGICPECGWLLNAEPLDSPGWQMWWRQWRIDRLHNWKAVFVRYCGSMSLTCVLGGLAVWRYDWRFLVPAILLFVLIGPSGPRILAYGLRERTKQQGSGGTD